MQITRCILFGQLYNKNPSTIFFVQVPNINEQSKGCMGLVFLIRVKLGVWGRISQPPEANGCLRAEPPAPIAIFSIFQ